MSNFTDVGDFHEKFGLPFVEEGTGCEVQRCPGPREVPDELLAFRRRFMDEELTEFTIAYADGDITGMADALIDLVYVAMGTAHLLGLPWEELWDDVQRANMAKRRAAADGSDSKRGSSWDVVKPEGWEAPHTEEILRDRGFGTKF